MMKMIKKCIFFYDWFTYLVKGKKYSHGYKSFKRPCCLSLSEDKKFSLVVRTQKMNREGGNIKQHLINLRTPLILDPASD